jgi:ABC-2 type transport system ATP-binding protein
MPDFFGVYDDLRCWEYLDFFARCYSLPAAERQAKVGQLLDLVDLTPKRNAFVQHLSRGQQQRLCLAHALMHDPPILLLDEPASGLDPRARVEFRELLRALREMGKTILLSSHILSELAEVCDEIGILDKGRLVAGGTTPSVRRQLHAGKSLRVRVLSDQEQALRILQGCPGVTAARLAEEGDLPPAYADDMDVQATAAQTLIVSFDGDEAARANLLAALIQQGIAVSNFHLHEDSLETLFLRLTADG